MAESDGRRGGCEGVKCEKEEKGEGEGEDKDKEKRDQSATT